ncbi:MAG: alkaline phosphatase family protein [Anaerolineales bacterium]|nr:alkaline phosphatase family protein [Anaerolineales bacterium]
MSEPHLPERLVILGIDGIRRDVFLQALADGRAHALARLLGSPDAQRGLHFEAVSNAPSITLSCRASLFTDAHPKQHGLMGNQFFRRTSCSRRT